MHSSLTYEEQPVSSAPIRASKTVAAPVNPISVEPPNFGTPKDVHVVEKPDITPMNANVASRASNVKVSLRRRSISNVLCYIAPSLAFASAFSDYEL